VIVPHGMVILVSATVVVRGRPVVMLGMIVVAVFMYVQR
jgi:hypothetical protein